MYVYEKPQHDPNAWQHVAYATAKFLVPLLKEFEHRNHSFPVNTVFPNFRQWDWETQTQVSDICAKLWGEYLRRMIWSFEYFIKAEEDEYDDLPNWGSNERQMMEQRYKEGMALFAKYFRDLWD
jgi:hypothetical protein